MAYSNNLPPPLPIFTIIIKRGGKVVFPVKGFQCRYGNPMGTSHEAENKKKGFDIIHHDECCSNIVMNSVHTFSLGQWLWLSW